MFIPIKVVGKQAPIFSKWTNSVHIPKKTKDFENTIRAYSMVYMRKTKRAMIPDKKPVFIFYRLNLTVPKRVKGEEREISLKNFILPTEKPDIDNVLKAINDGMKGVVFEDDKQINDVHVARRYAEEPSIEIHIFNNLNEFYGFVMNHICTNHT